MVINTRCTCQALDGIIVGLTRRRFDIESIRQCLHHNIFKIDFTIWDDCMPEYFNFLPRSTRRYTKHLRVSSCTQCSLWLFFLARRGDLQSGSAFTIIFLKYTLLLGSWPCNAKVPLENTRPSLPASLFTLSGSV